MRRKVARFDLHTHHWFSFDPKTPIVLKSTHSITPSRFLISRLRSYARFQSHRLFCVYLPLKYFAYQCPRGSIPTQHLDLLNPTLSLAALECDRKHFSSQKMNGINFTQNAPVPFCKLATLSNLYFRLVLICVPK